jgi:heme/copper-type cytochrome/quinol oxidase subunit 2
LIATQQSVFSTSSRRHRWGLGALVPAVALLSLSLTGCTSGPSTPSAAPGSSSATPAASSASPSVSVAPSQSASSPEASQPNAQVTIDITIADGQVTPNGKKIDVEVGQQVVLNVTSDEHDEIHAHIGGDGYELEVAPGKKVTGSFTLTSPGSFDVESHHLEKTIVILNAR